MQKINNELIIKSFVAQQHSSIRNLSDEKFGEILDIETKKDEITVNQDISNEEIDTENIPKINIFMQNLQNTAQLNRMVIEAVA